MALTYLYVIRRPMGRVELTIRAPTGGAWVTSITSIICTGELYYETQKNTVIELFNWHFTASQLLPTNIGLGIISLACLLWLLSIYTFPGKIVIDSHARTLERIRFRGVFGNLIEHPLASWQITISYYSVKDQQNYRFKKVFLVHDSHKEVLLFGDLSQSEKLAKLLQDHLESFLSYKEIVEHP